MNSITTADFIPLAMVAGGACAIMWRDQVATFIQRAQIFPKPTEKYMRTMRRSVIVISCGWISLGLLIARGIVSSRRGSMQFEGDSPPMTSTDDHATSGSSATAGRGEAETHNALLGQTRLRSR
jgi:hypothetical protein